MSRFLAALGWSLTILATMVWLAVIVDRVIQMRLPRQEWWLYGALVAAGVGALVYAMIRRPSAHDAAVAIDEKLGLKEKFSTALYARSDNDPFAQAAVRDAEQTAEKVSLQKKFPIAIPRTAYSTLALIVCVALTAWLVDPMDLFGKEAERKRQIDDQAKVEQTRKVVEQALATVNAIPKAAVDEQAIKLAKQDLEALLNQPMKDSALAHRTAMKALQDVDKAVAEKIKNSQRFANAQNDAKMFKSMSAPSNEQGPVADAHRAIAKGDFTNAVNKIDEAVKKFDQMDDKEKEKAAQQMKNMAQQLQQLANDPAAQQKMQQQLQQLGASQQQAQQMMQQMQQAAAGDKQAAQQLQQQAQQLMQQMNNGQGPTQQQQQQINQMMQQMQAQANGAAQAQQMAQAAQQMAQAMQQAAQQNGQPGQQNQQMAQGQAQMQQQLQQMQAAQQDAQQIAAAQQAAQQAAQDAANAMNGQGQGQNPGQQPGGGQGAQGQWAQGDPQQPGQGMGGPGQGQGGRAPKEQAPGAFKQEVSPVQDIDEGKILASMFVKDDSLKGESKVELGEIIETAQKESTDEVDQDRISRQAQGVVQEYFRTVEQDLK